MTKNTHESQNDLLVEGDGQRFEGSDEGDPQKTSQEELNPHKDLPDDSDMLPTPVDSRHDSKN